MKFLEKCNEIKKWFVYLDDPGSVMFFVFGFFVSVISLTCIGGSDSVHIPSYFWWIGLGILILVSEFVFYLEYRFAKKQDSKFDSVSEMLAIIFASKILIFIAVALVLFSVIVPIILLIYGLILAFLLVPIIMLKVVGVIVGTIGAIGIIVGSNYLLVKKYIKVKKK